jgi:hypothetical protein
MDSVQKAINEQDKANRIAEEERILKLSASLTNGNAGCTITMGEVAHWTTKQLVEHGKLLRMVASELPMLQKKVDCELAHHGRRMGKITLFGFTYKMPLTAAIICGTIIYLVIKTL